MNSERHHVGKCLKLCNQANQPALMRSLHFAGGDGDQEAWWQQVQRPRGVVPLHTAGGAAFVCLSTLTSWKSRSKWVGNEFVQRYPYLAFTLMTISGKDLIHPIMTEGKQRSTPPSSLLLVDFRSLSQAIQTYTSNIEKSGAVTGCHPSGTMLELITVTLSVFKSRAHMYIYMKKS